MPFGVCIPELCVCAVRVVSSQVPYMVASPETEQNRTTSGQGPTGTSNHHVLNTILYTLFSNSFSLKNGLAKLTATSVRTHQNGAFSKFYNWDSSATPAWDQSNLVWSHDILRRQTRQIWGIWKLRPAYGPETSNLGKNRGCFVPCDFELWWMNLEQGKSEGFDSCDRPSNLSQIGLSSSIFQPVWPWNLMDDPKKQ